MKGILSNGLEIKMKNFGLLRLPRPNKKTDEAIQKLPLWRPLFCFVHISKPSTSLTMAAISSSLDINSHPHTLTTVKFLVHLDHECGSYGHWPDSTEALNAYIPPYDEDLISLVPASNISPQYLWVTNQIVHRVVSELQVLGCIAWAGHGTALLWNRRIARQLIRRYKEILPALSEKTTPKAPVYHPTGNSQKVMVPIEGKIHFVAPATSTDTTTSSDFFLLTTGIAKATSDANDRSIAIVGSVDGKDNSIDTARSDGNNKSFLPNHCTSMNVRVATPRDKLVKTSYCNKQVIEAQANVGKDRQAAFQRPLKTSTPLGQTSKQISYTHQSVNPVEKLNPGTTATSVRSNETVDPISFTHPLPTSSSSELSLSTQLLVCTSMTTPVRSNKSTKKTCSRQHKSMESTIDWISYAPPLSLTTAGTDLSHRYIAPIVRPDQGKSIWSVPKTQVPSHDATAQIRVTATTRQLSVGSDTSKCAENTPKEAKQRLKSNLQVKKPPIHSNQVGIHSRRFVSTATRTEHGAHPQIIVIETGLHLTAAGRALAERCPVVAIDCKANDLSLILVCTGNTTFIFDCVKLSPVRVCQALQDLLTDPTTTKLFHDLTIDAEALAAIGKISTPLQGTLDSQLVMECATGNMHMGFDKMLETLGRARRNPPQSRANQHIVNASFGTQQLRDYALCAASNLPLLLAAKDDLIAALGFPFGRKLGLLQRASDSRASAVEKAGGWRHVGFQRQKFCRIASLELSQEFQEKALLDPRTLEVSDDAVLPWEMLPEDIQEAIQDVVELECVSEIVLDKGKTPSLWSSGSRTIIDHRTINEKDIASIANKLGSFETGNVVEQPDYTAVALRNRYHDIIGLTIRTKTVNSFSTQLIADLLFSNPTKSILFLGDGEKTATACKTARKAAKLIKEHTELFPVASNSGSGDCTSSRTNMGGAIDTDLMEQGHNSILDEIPHDVVVMDEIENREDAEAARACRGRGDRLIASANGDLRTLLVVGDSIMQGLMGCIGPTDPEQQKSGIKQRARVPIFDVIVEHCPGSHNECRVVVDAATAVDKVLEGKAYAFERRVYDPITGRIHLRLEYA